MKYERLTHKVVAEVLRNTEGESWDSDNIEAQCYIRLAELEDKIESGEIISTQLKDSSDQEIIFFVEHNKSIRKGFANELKVCLQADLTRGKITQETYDIFVDKINYCLGEVEK